MATEGQSVAPAPAPVAAARRSHRLRNVLLIVIAFALVLGGVAAGTLFYFYDKATAIDRSTPQVTTEQFLDATLVLKDSAKTSLFICSDWSADAAMAAVAAPTDPRISVSWGDITTTTNGSNATVAVRVFFRLKVTGGVQQQVETWTLSMQNQDGWRVCGMAKEASTPPTAG